MSDINGDDESFSHKHQHSRRSSSRSLGPSPLRGYMHAATRISGALVQFHYRTGLLVWIKISHCWLAQAGWHSICSINKRQLVRGRTPRTPWIVAHSFKFIWIVFNELAGWAAWHWISLSCAHTHTHGVIKRWNMAKSVKCDTAKSFAHPDHHHFAGYLLANYQRICAIAK